MERTERLLDLVATLLDAAEPIPFSRIRELFPDYDEGSESAGLRKFERDKLELEELGLPVRMAPSENGQPPAYLIDRHNYYVPNLNLRSDEWALLYGAGGAVLDRGDFPGSRDLSYALRKIAFTRGGAPIPQFSDSLAFTGKNDQRREAVRQSLEVLWAAVLHRKRVTFEYRSGQGEATARTLDVYGVAFRRGQWIAVGHDHTRDALRTFRVDRMRLVVANPARPRSPDFLIPRGFHIDDHLHQQAWEIHLHEPIKVVLEIDPSLIPLAERLFPRSEANEDGTRLTLQVSNRDGLVRQALALGQRVRIVSPPELRQRAIDLLNELRTGLAAMRRKKA